MGHSIIYLLNILSQTTDSHEWLIVMWFSSSNWAYSIKFIIISLRSYYLGFSLQYEFSLFVKINVEPNSASNTLDRLGQSRVWNSTIEHVKHG